MTNERGTVLVEAALVVSLLVVILAWGHLGLLRSYRAELRALQRNRLSYDGVVR